MQTELRYAHEGNREVDKNIASLKRDALKRELKQEIQQDVDGLKHQVADLEQKISGVDELTLQVADLKQKMSGVDKLMSGVDKLRQKVGDVDVSKLQQEVRKLTVEMGKTVKLSYSQAVERTRST